MATTTLEPQAGAPAYRRSWVIDWLTTVDHKKIGILYIVNGFLFFFAAGILALVVRSELAVPGLQILDADTFNQAFTMHGTIMLFLFIIPTLSGFANYIVPLQLGAPDMAFPRINALSFWLLPLGGLLIFSGYLFGGAAAEGWTAYSPLTAREHAQGVGTDLWIIGLTLVGTASILGAVNFITTVFKMRAPGMTLFRMPIFVWTVLVTAVLILLATPVLTAGLIALFIDRNYGGSFFDPTVGGNPILWQHIFWFFGHPEVYIVILPAMGVVSEVLPVFSRKPLFGYKAFVFATIAIGLLSWTVWAHHMFTTGAVFLPFFSFMTALIAIPTGIKMFNWLGTLYRGKITLTHGDALRSRLHRHVPDRRHQRRHARLAADRLPCPGHVLRRRPPALRLLRRCGVRGLRGDVLLVPEDDRSQAQRAARQGPLLDALHRLQPRLLPDAPAGAVRHAASDQRLQRGHGLDVPEHRLDRRRIPDCGEHHPVPHQRGRHAHQRRARRRRPVGGEHAGVGDNQPATAVQLRPAAADPFGAAACSS